MGGLAIVVPAYNEERRIAGVAEIISSSEKCRGAEIVLVVDGTDKTEEVAKREFAKSGALLGVVRSAKRLGKGGAVWAGILASDAEIVGFMDADGPVSAEELDGIIGKCEETGNCIIASREIGKRKDSRRALSAIYNVMARAMFGRGVSDTQCGCKVFLKRLAGDSPFLISGFAFDVELLRRVMDNGGRIEEYPINPKISGRGTFSVIGAPRMLLDLIRLRILGAWRNGPQE